jgi:hypothetical protein
LKKLSVNNMGYCLIPQLADKFKKALSSGEIKPVELSEMSSKERQDFFGKLIGETDAPNVNALFESKLLLKNQQQGMITWAKTISGLKEPAKRDIFATIERLDKALNPTEEKAFLNDLVNKRLGTEVTMEESKKIFDLSKAIEDAKAGLNEDGVTFKSDEAKLKYGEAKTALNEYVKELKSSSMNLTKEEFKNNPFGATEKAISQAAGTFKSATSSMDNSGILRQGWKTLMTNPDIWRKNAAQTFRDIWDTLGDKDAMKAVYADAFSRENSLNGYYKKAKLAVGVTEEAFPSSIPEKIPGYKRLYQASQNAYAGFLYRQRMDIFDKYIDIAKKTGVELSDKELSSIGNMVNSLTGRGSFGRYEGEAINAVNNIFFSPRLIKSHFDTLGGHVLTGGGGLKAGSNFVRKEAAKNLLKIISGTAGILMTAKAINPDSVELDSRSADFGKIKIGNTRFDVTGGMGSVAVLASRLIRNSSKSSTTGKVTELNSGKFGSQTKGDVLVNFAENKLSPMAALIDHLWVKGTDFKGNKPTVMGEAKTLLAPIGLQNFVENAKDPKAANLVLTTIADALGISTNTYGKNDFKKGK